MIEGIVPYVLTAKYETPEHNKLAYIASIPFAETARVLSTTTVRGGESLPKEGAGLLVLNHISGRDPFILQWLAIKYAQRTIRTLARRTLIEPQARESDSAKARRTQATVDNREFDELSITSKFYRRALAAYLRQFNTIPVDIGGRTVPQLYQEVKGEVMAGRLVGWFIQGTRRPRLDLLDSMDGVAVFVEKLKKEGLEPPIYPIGISGTNGSLTRNITVHIGPKLTYSDFGSLPTERQGRIEVIKDRIIDEIAKQVIDDDVKPAWLLQKAGLTREEIEEVYKRDPDLASAAALAKSANRIEANLADELRLIDRFAIFAA